MCEIVLGPSIAPVPGVKPSPCGKECFGVRAKVPFPYTVRAVACLLLEGGGGGRTKEVTHTVYDNIYIVVTESEMNLKVCQHVNS